jgi:hypothetical protein
VRNGRRYLYRDRRVNGPVKEYLAADDRFGFGDLMAHELERLQRRERKLRRLRRETRVEYRARIDDLLGAAATANTDLRVLAEGVLHALGYHRHKREEWRMRRELALFKDVITELERRNSSARKAGQSRFTNSAPRH